MAGTLSVQQIQGLATAADPTTVEISSGHVLKAPGHIIQVVQSAGMSGDHTNSTTNTWTDTGMKVAITPQFATSKILVNFTAAIRLAGSGTVLRGSIRISRKIGGGAQTIVMNSSGLSEMFQVRNAANEHSAVGGFEFLDSPATTSQVEYEIESYLVGDSGSSNIILWRSARGTNMVVKEVAQ